MSARRCSIAAVLAFLVVVPVGNAAPGTNGRIAFTSNRSGEQQLYTVAPDGSGLQRLTFHNATDQSPSWSPDAKRLVFESLDSGSPLLWILGPDGRTRLSPDASGTSDAQAAWSPDGSRIAFGSTRGGTWQIWTIGADGSGLRRLTSDFSTSPAWSPDGSKLAYVGFDTVWVMNADGSGAHRLTSGVVQPEGSPAWSPDGRTIVFGRFDADWRVTNARELYAIDADGSNERRLTSGGYANYEPSWSPDGTQLAFQRKLGTGGRFQLAVMDADGANVRVLAPSYADDIGPDWGVFDPQPTLRDDPSGPNVVLAEPREGAYYIQGDAARVAYGCFPGPLQWPVVSCVADAPVGSPLDTSRAGTFTFTVTGIDYMGGTTVVTNRYTVLDFTPPTISIGSPQNNAAYAQGENVVVRYSCDDALGSGIQACFGTLPDGATLPTGRLGTFGFEVRAFDNAGNQLLVTYQYRVVDVTPPQVSITAPVNGQVYRVGEAATPQYDCHDEDGGSGVASCEASPLDTSTPGTREFTVTARDRQGNVTTAKRSERARDADVQPRSRSVHLPLVHRCGVGGTVRAARRRPPRRDGPQGGGALHELSGAPSSSTPTFRT